MAFTDLGSIASGGSTGNNQASLTIATTANCAAGELIVVAVTDDNISTGGGDTLETSGVVIGTAAPFALTKGRQNSTNLAAQAGASVSLWWGVLPYAIASGQNIVASFTNAGTSDATALSARHFSFASLFNSVAVEATNAGTATTTNPGSLNATTANIACLRIRAIGCEWDATQTLTVTASWTAWAEGSSNATLTLTEQVIEVEHRISTGTGDASAPTLGSACDSASVYVAFKEVANPFRRPILDVPRGPQRGREYWIDAVGFVAAAEPPVTLAADAGAYALTGSDAALTVGITADTTNLPAGGANWFNPWGRKRPVQDWLRGSIPAVPVIFTAASGSYSLTGSAATWALGHAAGSGSYTITGSAAALALRHVAGAGSYNLTGSAAGLTVAVNFAATAGSYTSTGSAVTFAFGQGAAAGAYTLTGADAAFVIPGAVEYLPAGMTGGYVPWRRPYPIVLRTSAGRVPSVAPVTLSADAGSYTLTGADAALVIPGAVTYLPAGMTGGYVPWKRPYPTTLLTRTGRPLSVAPVTLSADAGSYTLTGSAADLVIPGAVTYLPAGMSGGYAPWARPPRQDWFWSVAYTTVSAGVTLSAEAGSYSLNGFAAGLTATSFEYIHRPPLITRIWSRAPRQDWFWSVGYLAQGGVVAAAGSYTITGGDTALALRLTANSGSYTVSGTAAVLAQRFAAGTGAYAITGTDAQLVQAGSITLVCGSGSYTLTGSDIAFGGTGITPPPVEAPGGNYAGVKVGASRGRMIRRRKRGELDLPPDLEPPPLSPSPPDLPPPAPGPSPPDLKPPPPGLMADVPTPQRISLPPMPDDEDEDEIALLIEILSRS